ncbi:DUF6304 family protein [Niastella sp. OAS944]|uniref:DUF6304 family protein n=1 Tax=Niastella sp. OAS944 TaxID=2664089 RepID=UPI00346DB1DA|nr:hypothetical protein [Chitinophagaceae bacterium OAS944]
MTETIKYKGLYKDSFGSLEIDIENDFNMLSMTIDGVEFCGPEFSDMAILNKAKYSNEQLKRFTFHPLRVYQTNNILESLCNCSLEIVFPQVIIDKLNHAEFYTNLKIEYSLGNVRPVPGTGIEHEKVKLTLTIDDKLYTGEGDYIEIAFNQIRDQFADKLQFKNCYGCMYGDYSVYGQSSFGSMLCFLTQKERYSKVTTKDEYMELDNADRQVQEIYCCDQFEIRKCGAGYRG